MRDFLACTAVAILPKAEALSGAAPAACRIFAAIGEFAGASRPIVPQRLPVCDRLEEALNIAAGGPPSVMALAVAIAALSPDLCWQRRKGADREPESFFDGHANALVVGPGGIEDRDDVQIGLSLMAPHVRYPDHAHPPEEVYVSLAGGAWRNEIEDWHEPGQGGLVYNPPGIVHAMRTDEQPLLAVWCLWAG